MLVVNRKTEGDSYYYGAGCVKCSGSGQQFFSGQLAAVSLNLEGIHVVSVVSYLGQYVLCFIAVDAGRTSGSHWHCCDSCKRFLVADPFGI